MGLARGEGSMRSRAKLCGAPSALVLVLVAVAVAPALVPAAASAASGGSSICKAYKAEQKKVVKASAALAREDDSGNWTIIKKDLLATFKGESGAEEQFDAYLSGASSKVRSAAAVVLKLDGTFTTIVQSSSSLTAYETGVSEAQDTPQVKSAFKVLDSYTTRMCGSSVFNN
jgi:hypothetical protein